MTPMLNLTDIFALSPLLIVFFSSLLILTSESFFSSSTKKYGQYVAFCALLLAFIAALYAPSTQNPLLTPWLRFDHLSQFFNLLFIAIGMGVVLLSPHFHGEYFFLLLASITGLLLIGSAADFLTLFLGIEALSIPLYILAGFIKKRTISHESAVKYFLTGALATAFLVYGIAFIYGSSGTTSLKNLTYSNDTFFLAGIAFITFALLFKAAVVPFHQWAPDVYAGAPTSVAAFMAVATKIGAFAALLRIFGFDNVDIKWNEALLWLAYLTLIYANFVALKQTQMRRFFAYSGIAQAGFLIIPFIAQTPGSQEALLFYFVVYALATLGCFAVLAALDERQEGVRMQDLKGLLAKAPMLAIFFSICLLTLAGIPPTIGFLTKFLILKEAFIAGYIPLVIVGLLASILSVYYYLRPIALMIGETDHGNVLKHPYFSCRLVAGAACLLILLLSLFPSHLWHYLGEIK